MDPWANGASSSFGSGSICSVGPIFHLWSDVWVPIFKPYQIKRILYLYVILILKKGFMRASPPKPEWIASLFESGQIA